MFWTGNFKLKFFLEGLLKPPKHRIFAFSPSDVNFPDLSGFWEIPKDSKVIPIYVRNSQELGKIPASSHTVLAARGQRRLSSPKKDVSFYTGKEGSRPIYCRLRFALQKTFESQNDVIAFHITFPYRQIIPRGVSYRRGHPVGWLSIRKK